MVVPEINRNHVTFLDEDIEEEDLTKQSISEEEKKYKKLSCKYSFYLFSKNHWIRKLCWGIVSSNYFEAVIISLICLAAFKLAIETYYLLETDPLVENVFYWVDFFLTIAFSLEFLLKTIALGFVFEENSYLRDSWNQLDFFIVLASILDLTFSEFNVPMIKVLRLLRIFRPLRFVTHNENMRIMVIALFQSFGPLCNTLAMVVVIWLMFSIVGVSFFAGKFQYCSVDPYQLSTREDCSANDGLWKTYDLNFDNSINGLIYLFELTTQENWPQTMLQATDCTDVDKVHVYLNF